MATDESQSTERPLIRLGDAGQAPILSYNVPQPSEYTGRNYIELEFDEDIWTETAYERPDPAPAPKVSTDADETPVFHLAEFQDPEALFVQYYYQLAEPVTFETDGGISEDGEGITLAPDGGFGGFHRRPSVGDNRSVTKTRAPTWRAPTNPRTPSRKTSKRNAQKSVSKTSKAKSRPSARETRRPEPKQPTGERTSADELSAEERKELGDIVFQKGGLEALAEEKPEVIPAVFDALSPTRRAEDTDGSAVTALAERVATAADRTVAGIEGTADGGPEPDTEEPSTHSGPTETGKRAAGDSTAVESEPIETPAFVVEDPAIGGLIEKYGAKSLAENLADGWRIREDRTFAGNVNYDLVPPEARPKPRLALVETYKLSNFLGDYGAGRTVQTFSLLPGEKHTISLKTYRMSEEKRSAATSILDGYESEVADEFGEELHAENSRKDTEESNFSYHAEASASAGWGWGKASVSGGVAGSTASSRESFAKNVANTTKKHAAKASTNRSVEVNTASESSTKAGEEEAITREIENINLSRTLNFVFRQMNQEFVSLLHLVDARVAFHNGDKRSYREFTLAELDSLLETFIDPSAHDEVRTAIWEALYFVFDYRGEHVPAIESHELTATDGSTLVDADGEDLLDPETNRPPSYWRFVPRSSTYVTPASETAGIESEPRAGPTVEGIIVDANTVSLATDGVIVEALLGQGEALDAYSQELQVQTGVSRALSNDLLRAEIQKQALGREIVEDADGNARNRALVFETVFGEPDEEDDPEATTDEQGDTEPVAP